ARGARLAGVALAFAAGGESGGLLLAHRAGARSHPDVRRARARLVGRPFLPVREPAARLAALRRLAERRAALAPALAARLAPRRALAPFVGVALADRRAFAARLVGLHRLVGELVADRRLEIGARLLDQPLAELVAQKPALQLAHLALGQFAELERAVGDADQP